MKELFQSADWKREKHVPVIDSADAVKKGEAVQFSVSVGKEIPHPNKTEHHIRWIEVYFQPDGAKFPLQLARVEFTAHGESVEGPDTSAVYSNPSVSCSFKTDKPGTLLASSFCNIHGLWESSKRLEIS
jgi:superoxide reductase